MNDLHFGERTVPRGDEWTIREDRSQLFSFLGGFFADGDGVDSG
jgi:hypothetical protein